MAVVYPIHLYNIGETREVWAGFVKRQFSSSGQWLDPVFHSVYVKLPFACNVCLILGIWDQLFCLEITFNKSCAFSIHQNTPGGMGHGPGGMGRCHVSYYFLDNENNTRSWYLPRSLLEPRNRISGEQLTSWRSLGHICILVNSIMHHEIRSIIFFSANEI